MPFPSNPYAEIQNLKQDLQFLNINIESLCSMIVKKDEEIKKMRDFLFNQATENDDEGCETCEACEKFLRNEGFL